MITVRCYSCGQSYQVNDSNAGKKLRCRDCETLLDIPVPTDAESAMIVDAPQTAAAPPPGPTAAPPPPAGPTYAGGHSPAGTTTHSAMQPPTGSGGKGGIIAAAVAGGVLLLAGLIVGIVFIVRAVTDDDPSKSDDVARNDEKTSKTENRNRKVPGATPYDRHEAAAKEVVGLMENLASALESVRDPNSARQAGQRIEKICDDLDALADRYPNLPKITVEQERELEQKYEAQMMVVQQRMQRVTLQAARNSQGEPGFLRSMNRLAQVSGRLEQL